MTKKSWWRSLLRWMLEHPDTVKTVVDVALKHDDEKKKEEGQKDGQ